MEWVQALKMWGWKETYQKFYMLRVLKIGRHVGTDEFGNKYFENLKYPIGQHRWVEHKNWDNSNIVEATAVPPVWHGWLHSMHDEVPETSVLSQKETGPDTVIDNDSPYKDHYNRKFLKQWRVNPSLARERGPGIFTKGYGSAEQPNGFYTQPGHPMSPFYKPQTVDIEEWDMNPSESKTASIKLEEGQEKWQKFYKLRQKMNEKRS